MELSLPGATPLSVIRHYLPYFVPVQQIVAECSAVPDVTACQQFVSTIYRYLHAFVARRQETVLAKVHSICLNYIIISRIYDFASSKPQRKMANNKHQEKCGQWSSGSAE